MRGTYFRGGGNDAAAAHLKQQGQVIISSLVIVNKGK